MFMSSDMQEDSYNTYFEIVKENHNSLFAEAEEIVLSEFLSALINECGINTIISSVSIKDLQDFSVYSPSLSPLGTRSGNWVSIKTTVNYFSETNKYITFTAIGEKDYFLGKILFVNPSSIKIIADSDHDTLSISKISDLVAFGLDTEQLNKLRNTLKGTIVLALNLIDIKNSQYQTTYINLLQEKYKLTYRENITEIIIALSPTIALALLEECCGFDGAANNPLRNGMGDPNSTSTSCFQYHPIILSNTSAYLSIPLIDFGEGCTKLTFGELPSSSDPVISSINQGLIPIHPYNLPYLKEKYSYIKQCGTIQATVTASRRTVMPVNSDFILKLSLRMQLGSRQRVLYMPEIQNAVIHSKLLVGLAKSGNLPDSTWIMSDIFGMSINKDEATTFMVRGGIDAVISNNGRGLPNHLRAIPGFAFFTRNVLSERTLFQDLVDNGNFEPWKLFAAIAKSLIYMQLDWIRMGIIPESHGQNTLYVLDLEKKSVEGLVIRDCEGLDFTQAGLNYIQDVTGLNHEGINDASVHASYLCAPEEELEQAMYDYSGSILDKQLIPFSYHLSQSYGIRIQNISAFLKATYIQYWQEKNVSFDEYIQILPDAQVQRNLLRLGLKLDKPRIRNRITALNDGTVIPSYQEMRSVL
jgi:hypothetical protein